MPCYRVCLLKAPGIIYDCYSLVCDSDDEAVIARARLVRNHPAVEIWAVVPARWPADR